MECAHYSVLLHESVEALNVRPDGIYVDGTLGGGGHAYEVLRRMTQEDGNGADISNVTIRNMCGYAAGTGLIQGDHDRKVRNIVLQDIDLTIGGGHRIVKEADENDHRRIGDGWRFYQPYAFAVLCSENIVCRNMRLHWSNDRSGLWETPFYAEDTVNCDFEQLSCDPLPQTNQMK